MVNIKQDNTGGYVQKFSTAKGLVQANLTADDESGGAKASNLASKPIFGSGKGQSIVRDRCNTNCNTNCL